MTQNRNKLINLLVGNVSNSIVHEILEKATKNEDLIKRYDKESTNSFNLAKKYREKINPASPLIDKDVEYIKNKVKNRVLSELLLRISKGYQGIDLGLVDEVIDKRLKELRII